MEIINRISLELTAFLSYSIRNILNLLENCHNRFYQVINTKNIIPPQYFTRMSSFEEQLKSYSPFTLIIFGLFLILLFYLLKKVLKKTKKVFRFFGNFKTNIALLYCKLPSVKAQLQKARSQIKDEFKKMFESNKFKKIEFLPNKQSYANILAKMEQNVSKDNIKADCGKLTGSVYCDNDQIKYIASEAAKMFLYSNLLHTDLYTYGRYLESELIKIGIDLFNGKEDACGLTTSGGTMSLINAIYAYSQRGKKMGIKKPELIIPETAHAGFIKACDLFLIKCIKIPLNKNDKKVNIKLVEKNITKNTIALVGSFPNFPHCVCDDIEALSNLAVKYKIPLHVDCCLGGFLVAFHEQAGITSTPKFDFRLPGVTSISADLHKYGLCPKGISLLLFSNHEYRKNIYFIYPHWLGGTYLTPSFEGSRTGGLIASSYAILTSMGKNFYADNARQIHNAVLKTREFIEKECDLIHVMGQPFVCGVSFTGQYIPNFYDLMSEKGYSVNYLNNPEGISFIFTSANVGNVDQYIKDLKEVHDKIKREKPTKISDKAKLYGMSFSLPESVARNAMDVIVDAILD